jgi:hypothetical protein
MQQYGEFIPRMSVLDLILNAGGEAVAAALQRLSQLDVL